MIYALNLHLNSKYIVVILDGMRLFLYNLYDTSYWFSCMYESNYLYKKQELV